MEKEENLSESESLAIITSMIQKAKSSYHDSGTSILLWGSVISIASFVTYLKEAFDFKIGFDIWLLAIAAIIPQIFISIKNRKSKQFKSHTDIAINAVWLTYAITILGLTVYQNIVPDATAALSKGEGWLMMKHFINGSKADEIVRPFPLSIYSIYILIYAMPTLANGIIKQFRPMVIGATIAYVLFVISCFTSFKYDMLLGTIAALACWFIPGIILRKKYNRQKSINV